MLKANRAYICVKCNADIVAGSHYAQWNKKKANTAWHIKCDNPSLEGYDPSLITMSSTFFAIYPNTCRDCLQQINKGDLAQLDAGVIKHASCPNPSGLHNGSSPSINPDPIDPTYDPKKAVIEPSYTEPKTEPKRVITPSNDGLLELIVAQVSEKLTDRVAESVIEVRDKSREVIDAMQSEIDRRMANICIPSIEIKRIDEPTLTIDNVHRQFKEVYELLSAKQNVYIWGAPGAGKSHLGPQIAKVLGVKYHCISLSEQSPEYLIKGFTSPTTGEYVSSVFVDLYDASNEGGLFQFTELDLANDNFRASLNTALENGFMPTDKGMIDRHPNFYVLADGNTAGRGAHPAFPSRIPFDQAFAARFFFLEFTYDWPLARIITQGINPESTCLVDWANNASAWALANGIPVVISPREVYAMAKLRKATSMTSEQIFDGVLRGLDIVSKEKLLQSFPLPTF
jgi:hypothetical protein